jgi:hypothetical protein
MNWSKEHLEARMLDAIEGRLSADQLIQLKELLREHPEMGDLDESLIYMNDTDAIDFDHSSLLKKESFNPVAYKTEEGSEKEKMSIAKMEGLLSIQEEKEFECLLKVDQELISHWEQVQQTKLIPNSGILFPSIKTLTKEKGRVIPFRVYFSYAAAASIILLLFLNWPSNDVQVRSASKIGRKQLKVEQNRTKSHIAATNEVNKNVSPTPKNSKVEHIELRPNDTRDCIVQEVYPQVEQIPNAQSYYLMPAIVDPIELAVVNPKPIQTPTNNKVAENNETIGFREFVIQKGNEKLFGTAKPSTADKYTTITNYLAQSVNIPITYVEKEDEQVKSTFFKLGVITVERKQTKK